MARQRVPRPRPRRARRATVRTRSQLGRKRGCSDRRGPLKKSLRPFRLVYVALSALYALNLWWVYAYNNSRGDLGHGCALPSPGCVGVAPLLGGFAMDAWQKKAFSATVVTIAVCMVWFGAGWAARRRAHVRTARQERPDSGVPSLTSPPHR